jgi:hypothetical protein
VDESIYTSTASELLNGKSLYGEVWCNHMPLAVYFCKWMFQLFGTSSSAIHLGSLLLALITSLVLYFIGSRFFSSRAGGLAALAFAVISLNYYTPRIIGYTPEQLTVVFIASAVFIFLYSFQENRSRGFFLVGLLSMAAVCSKPSAVPEAAMFILVLFCTARRNKFREILWLVSGFISGIALLLLTLQQSGSLDAWWHQSILSRMDYVNHIAIFDFLRIGSRQLLGFGLIFLWLWIMIWSGRKGITSSGFAGRFLWIWLVAAFAGVAMGRRFYANYYIQVFPVLSLMAALAVDQILRGGIRARYRWAPTASMILLSMTFLWFHARTLAHWYFLVDHEAHQNTEMWQMCVIDRNMKAVAEKIQSVTKPDDTIFVWGPSPEFYFLSGRRMATRYPFFDVHDPAQPPYGDEEQTTLEALKRNPPSLIVDNFREVRLKDRPGWDSLLMRHYGLLMDDWEVRLYLLKTEMPAKNGL